jgi:DNA-binding beta-propeller fold protein YncE
MRILIALIASVATATAPSVLAKIKVGAFAAPCAAQGGGKYVWVSEYGQPYLLKIDPKTDKVVARIGIGSGSCGLGYGAGSLWVEDTSSSTVSRVSVATGKRIAIKVGIQPYDATFAYGAAWTTAYSGGELERIDPAKNRVVARWKTTSPVGVVGAFGSMWAAGADGVIRVDAATNKLVATIPLDGGGGWTAASSDAVWVTSPKGLVRLDPQANAVVTEIPLPGAPYLGDPDVVDGQVWVPEIRKSAIAVVDPATNTVVRTVKAGAGPFVVTQIRGEAWVPSWKGRDIWRIAP